MTTIHFRAGELTSAEQAVVTNGFARHAAALAAPPFTKSRLVWCAQDKDGTLVGAATADQLWDWIYIDELWVEDSCRGTGLGRDLMVAVENYARAAGLAGVWLWTQSWQAEGFYRHLGYIEFTRFNDFPRGHSRIGYRKDLRSGR